MQTLGVGIDNLSQSEVVNHIRQWFDGEAFHRISTVGPEFLLLATKNRAFRGALESADLRVADGVGLHLPFALAGESLVARITGADLLPEIFKLAEAKRLTVGLMLDPGGLSNYEAIKKVLLAQYSELSVAKFSPEYLTGPAPIPYHIVLCNYGAPLQEIMLAGLKGKPGNIRLAMGVGGAFDFLTGRIPRAPKVIRTLGLEWAWRLWQQPKRWYRMWNAVIVFPAKVLCQK